MELDPKDKKYFMTESGMKETGLDLLIKTGYKILKLITFFTTTPKEKERGLYQNNVGQLKQQV